MSTRLVPTIGILDRAPTFNRVRVTLSETVLLAHSRINDLITVADSDGVAGEYYLFWEPSGDHMGLFFYFSDPASAIEFKMRFG